MTILLLLATSALHALALSNLPLIPKNDSVWYLGLTHALSSGQVFDLYSIGEPHVFDVAYPLGYPLFLDALLLLFGWERLAAGVLAAQHLAAIGSVLCIHRIGVGLGRPGAGLLAAAAYALYFPALYYAHLMISETIFVFLCLLAVLFLVRWVRSPRDRDLLASGVLIGLATFVRPVAALQAGLLGLAALVARPLPGDARLRTGARRLALLGAPLVLLTAFTLVHNRAFYGRATLGDATGRHLIDRVWAFDRLVEEGDPNTQRILGYCRASGVDFEIPGLWWDSYKALRFGSGLDAPAADALFGRAALATIRAHPFEYLAGTPVALGRLLGDPDTWLPSLERVLTPAAFERYLDRWTRFSPDPARTASSRRAVEARRDLRRRMALTAPSGSERQRDWLARWYEHSPRFAGAGWLLLAILILARFGRRGDLAPLLLALAAVLPAALLEYPFARYRQPAVPYMLLVLASAATEVARRIGPLVLSRRGSPEPEAAARDPNRPR